MFLIGSLSIEFGMSLASCFATSTPLHPYKLNDMDFSEFNFNEIAGVMGYWNRVLSTVSQQKSVFFFPPTLSPLCAVIAINALSNVFGDIMLLK